MARLTKDGICDAIQEGIENAHGAYCKMSGWKSSWLAPEYYFVCQIAQQIASHKECYVTLEENVRKTLKNTGSNGVGRPRTGLPKAGRFDIVVWWKGRNPQSSRPRAIIEVKHDLSDVTSEFKKDVEEIRDSLIKNQTGGSLQFGCFAFWTGADPPKGKHKSSSHRIEEKTNKILRVAKDIVDNKCEVSIHRNIHKENGGWSWAAVVLIIEPVKRQNGSASQ